MSVYTSINIIYNPKSTGSGEAMARDFKAKLLQEMPKQKITLTQTKYAGHAEKIAYDLAKKTSRALVISASGDGGYHEVINGLMKARAEGARPVAGLLPAGNANDHYHSLHDQQETDLIRSVVKQNERKIDLLKLQTKYKGKTLTSYAHSYIGLGLTPKAGHELNKTDLNRFNELWIVMKVIFDLKPVRLVVDGKPRIYDSLIFSNVGKMSKVMSLSEQAELDDGKFEVAVIYRHTKFQLLRYLLKASTVGLKVNEQHTKFSFQTTKPALVQLDGEIEKIDGETKAVISLERTILTCIV
jgi:diacylglycerol kinase (ATP)